MTMNSQVIRPAAVAGSFYPENATELHSMVTRLLDSVEDSEISSAPKALVVPHAGYIYSGAVAASAYRLLINAHAMIKRVILLGPCHRVAVSGLATSSATCFETPLGQVPLDRRSIEQINRLPYVSAFDATHELEHSLEVQLPFLQTVLDEFELVPLVVGDVLPDTVAEVLQHLWGDKETLIVISSDLSHFHSYDEARKMDAAANEAIERMQPQNIHYDQACGRIPLQGFLIAAQSHGLIAKTLALANSGDTAGSKDRVVGYGAWAFSEVYTHHA